MGPKIARSRLHSSPLLAWHFIAVALIYLCSCSRPPSPQAEPPLEGSIPVRLWRYFNEGIDKFGNSRLGIIANLGQPKHAITGEELDRTKKLSPEERRYIWGHGAEIENEIIELVYNGLSTKILKVNSPPYREFVYNVIVTSGRYRMPGNLNVGSKRQDVIRFLGNPSRSNDRGDSFVVVQVGDFGEQVGGYKNSIIFSYRGESVSRISFWLYLD
jgi:hypothetical protein